MALCTIADVKLQLGIADSSVDSILTACVSGADAAIKSYCHSQLEQATYTHYLDGNGQFDVVLPQRPVSAVASVYLDSTGMYGQKAGGFAVDTLLTAGDDYVLVLDAPDSSGGSHSGILRRVWPGNMNYFSQTWQGTLTMGARATGWPKGMGNIKVTYTAGFAVVPSDLMNACMLLAIQNYIYNKTGGLRLNSESLGEYSYQLLSGKNKSKEIPEIGVSRGLLARYRETQVI